MATDIGLTPSVGDPFMQAWERAVAAYFQGDFGRALEQVDAADTLVPGLWDVHRLRFLLKDLEEFRREITPTQTP
jgi:hypothetical protein